MEDTREKHLVSDHTETDYQPLYTTRDYAVMAGAGILFLAGCVILSPGNMIDFLTAA